MNVGSLKFPGLGGVCHVLLVAFSIWLGVAGQFFCLAYLAVNMNSLVGGSATNSKHKRG